MQSEKTNTEQMDTTDPPILLAILLAAHRTGDRLLETVARRELADRHAIKIQIGRNRSQPNYEGAPT